MIQHKVNVQSVDASVWPILAGIFNPIYLELRLYPTILFPNYVERTNIILYCWWQSNLFIYCQLRLIIVMQRWRKQRQRKHPAPRPQSDSCSFVLGFVLLCATFLCLCPNKFTINPKETPAFLSSFLQSWQKDTRRCHWPSSTLLWCRISTTTLQQQQQSRALADIAASQWEDCALLRELLLSASRPPEDDRRGWSRGLPGHLWGLGGGVRVAGKGEGSSASSPALRRGTDGRAQPAGGLAP